MPATAQEGQKWRTASDSRGWPTPLKVPVGVPVTTLKFTLLDETTPGAGLVTTPGKAPGAARSLLDNGTENWLAPTKPETEPRHCGHHIRCGHKCGTFTKMGREELPQEVIHFNFKTSPQPHRVQHPDRLQLRCISIRSMGPFSSIRARSRVALLLDSYS